MEYNREKHTANFIDTNVEGTSFDLSMLHGRSLVLLIAYGGPWQKPKIPPF